MDNLVNNTYDIFNEYSEYLNELESRLLPEDLQRELEIYKVLPGIQVG